MSKILVARFLFSNPFLTLKPIRLPIVESPEIITCTNEEPCELITKKHIIYTSGPYPVNKERIVFAFNLPKIPPAGTATSIMYPCFYELIKQRQRKPVLCQYNKHYQSVICYETRKVPLIEAEYVGNQANLYIYRINIPLQTDTDNYISETELGKHKILSYHTKLAEITRTADIMVPAEAPLFFRFEKNIILEAATIIPLTDILYITHPEHDDKKIKVNFKEPLLLVHWRRLEGQE